MIRKPVVLITGANGEIGHGLITRLASEGSRSIITTMVACCLLTIFFMSLTLGHKAVSAGRDAR